jgi:hypothetical protein
MNNIGRNMKYAHTSGIEGILKLRTFKGFKKQVACETANRNE